MTEKRFCQNCGRPYAQLRYGDNLFCDAVCRDQYRSTHPTTPVPAGEAVRGTAPDKSKAQRNGRIR